MIEIENDHARNLFIIRYHGRISADDTAHCLDPIRAQLEQTRPGFGLLADLTDLEWMDVACAPHIETTMDFANSKGVAAVVRVIPDPTRDIGLQIMSRFHYRSEVQVLTTSTMEEALRVLFD